MKRIFYAILILASFFLILSCNEEKLEDLQAQINSLKTEQIATINAQVSNINLSIQTLQNTNTDLKSYILTLQKELADLQKADEQLTDKIAAAKAELEGDIDTAKADVIAQLDAYKQQVNNQISTLTNTISTLQEKDQALEKSISDLKTYIDNELKNAKDWASATFATLQQFNTLSTEFSSVKVTVESCQSGLAQTNEDLTKAKTDLSNSISSLDASVQEQILNLTTDFNSALATATDNITKEYKDAIAKAISTSESSIKEWVNEQLSGYYTISEADAKISALKTDLEGQLATQKTYLEGLISNLETALNKKINDNKALIDQLDANADALAQDIATNAQNISANASAIANNAEDIQKNAGDIATCNSLIENNKQLIAQNKTAIEKNASDIVSLNGQMSANITAIAKNASDIASNAALIATNASAIANNARAISQNAADIEGLRNLISTTKNEITQAYTTAISTAINTLDGKLSTQMTDEINTAITTLDNKIQGELTTIKGRLTALENDVDSIHGQIMDILADIAGIHASITDLLSRIQSVTVIPTVSDGSVAVCREYNDINFEIFPLSVAQKLPEIGLDCFSMKAAETAKTKAVGDFTDLPISNIKYKDGIVTVTASCANIGMDFFTGLYGESARLHIGYGNVNISSGYFSLSPTISSGDADKDTPLSFEFIQSGTLQIWLPTNAEIQYRINNGEWNKVIGASYNNEHANVNINMMAGDVIVFLGDNESLNGTYGTTSERLRFYSAALYYAYGNVMSLIDSKYYPLLTEIKTKFGMVAMFQGRGDLGHGLCNHPTKKLCLPATKLSDYCYEGMFENCHNLTTAPDLPATELGRECYAYMFNECHDLTKAPDILPAITLAKGCYSRMFLNCTSLHHAPILPGKELVDECYSQMFQGCSSLNYIEALFEVVSGSDCTNTWVKGVSSTGTFVKSSLSSFGVYLNSGIPSGWTVQTK